LQGQGRDAQLKALALRMAMNNELVVLDDPDGLQNFMRVPFKKQYYIRRVMNVVGQYGVTDPEKFPPLAASRIMNRIAEHGLAPFGHGVFHKVNPLVVGKQRRVKWANNISASQTLRDFKQTVGRDSNM